MGLNEWISVEDRLPEINELSDISQEVLCYLMDKTIHIASKTKLGTWICIQGMYKFVDSSITHWMPLPEKPK